MLIFFIITTLLLLGLIIWFVVSNPKIENTRKQNVIVSDVNIKDVLSEAMGKLSVLDFNEVNISCLGRDFIVTFIWR